MMGYELETTPDEARWFAVWTRSRQEKASAAMLESLGVPHYLPLRHEVREWSDRKQTVTFPLFNGYLFVRMNPAKDSRLQVLKTPGIVDFVRNQTGPLPIPDEQIEAVRTVLSHGLPCSVGPVLKEGDRVRVIRGALFGLEGSLVRANSTSQLVISIDMIQQSLAVAVSRRDVEPVCSNAA